MTDTREYGGGGFGKERTHFLGDGTVPHLVSGNKDMDVVHCHTSSN